MHGKISHRTGPPGGLHEWKHSSRLITADCARMGLLNSADASEQATESDWERKLAEKHCESQVGRSGSIVTIWALPFGMCICAHEKAGDEHTVWKEIWIQSRVRCERKRAMAHRWNQMQSPLHSRHLRRWKLELERDSLEMKRETSRPDTAYPAWANGRDNGIAQCRPRTCVSHISPSLAVL